MSYEFNPESQALELPNPYKIENLALLASAAVCIFCGLIAIILVKDRLIHAFNPAVGLATTIGISTMGLGIAQAVRALRQLRFFFGRNRPESLAPTLAAGVEGDSLDAEQCRETLRHNALTFAEPKGPINGLLYSWLPQLIFSPAVIQRSAQRQVQTFLHLMVIFASFLLCRLLVGDMPANAGIGILYGLLAYYYISPLRQFSVVGGPEEFSGDMGSGGLILMVVIAIVGPVALAAVSSHLPATADLYGLGGLSINLVFTIGMLLALSTVALYIMALRMQLGNAPQEVGTARVLESVTMNAHPNKLMEELDRILMQDWFSQIPNRRYTQKLPHVNGQQGRFGAEILDETQPQPKPNCTATDLSHALSQPYFKWLALLSAMGMACISLAASVSLLVVTYLLNDQTYGSSLALALSVLAVGMYAQHSAHTLWGRFDFVSSLIWVEILGSYESAKVNVGNQITGNVHTAKNVINIESMTMRVWVSEIESVIFGKDAKRQLIRMRGLHDKAAAIASSLKGFGESRSMIVAPTTANDAARAQKLGEINQAIGSTVSSTPQIAQQVSTLLTQSAATGVRAGTSPGVNSEVGAALAAEAITGIPTTCSQCASVVLGTAKFCSNCGAPAPTDRT